MGNSFDNVCCITNDDLLIKDASATEHESSYSFNSQDDSAKSFSMHRGIPCSQIIFSQEVLNEPVTRLSRLPISYVNYIKKQKGDPHSNYEVIKPIGKGTFGHVFKVIHKVTGIIRCMKVIPKNNLTPGFTDDEIEQEINILKKLAYKKVMLSKKNII